MKPDPRKEAERWLRQAEHELRAGETLSRTGFYAEAWFMAQQAAEMALKALMYFQGARFVREHSLTEILKQLVHNFPNLGQFQASAGRLDQYYLTPRYPNAVPGGAPFELFTDAQAKEAVEMASKIVGAVGSIIRQSS